MEIVIIAPHSRCVDKKNRDCDRQALSAANKLYNKVKTLAPTHIIFADRLRKYQDLNRLSSYDSPIRYTLREIVKQCTNRGNKVLLYEIHSFPEGIKGFTGNDVVLLDILENQQINFNASFSDSDVKWKTMEGSPVNSIQKEFAFSPDVEAHLLEFNEDNNENEDRVINIIVSYTKEKINDIFISQFLRLFLGFLVVLFIIIFFTMYGSNFGNFVNNWSRGHTL